MTTAAALRAEGQHRAESAADMRVVAMVDKVIADAIASGRVFDCNEIRDLMPTSESQGLVGARVDAARKRGEIEACGFVRSTLPSTRGAWIKRWRATPKSRGRVRRKGKPPA